MEPGVSDAEEPELGKPIQCWEAVDRLPRGWIKLPKCSDDSPSRVLLCAHAVVADMPYTGKARRLVFEATRVQKSEVLELWR